MNPQQESFTGRKPRAQRIELGHDNFNRARELWPEGVTNFYRQAMRYARIQNKTKPALHLLEQAVANWETLTEQEKDRRHQEKKNYVKSLYRSASILLETGEATRALDRIQACLKQDEKTSHISLCFKYFALGKVLFSMGQYDRAKDALRFSLQSSRKGHPVDFVHELLAGRDPENTAVWEARIRLLGILDDRPRLARAVATAEKHLPKEQVNAWISRDISADTPRPGTDTDPAVDLFARMHARQERLERFMALFAGREDVFARQWTDKAGGKSGYMPMRRPMEKTDLEDHLKGLKTYGIYLMAQDATVRCGIIDADLVKPLRGSSRKAADLARIKKEQVYMISRIQEASQALGLHPLVEISGGKGFHFWFFSDPPVPTSAMRKILASLAGPLAKDLSCFDLANSRQAWK